MKFGTDKHGRRQVLELFELVDGSPVLELSIVEGGGELVLFQVLAQQLARRRHVFLRARETTGYDPFFVRERDNMLRALLSTREE